MVNGIDRDWGAVRVWIRMILAVGLCLFVLGGCRRRLPQIEERFVAGKSVEGRPIDVTALGSGEDVTLILATIHGNENAGTPLVLSLAELLRRQPDLLEGRRVVMVPVANPDGFAKLIRNNARGIDLNRNFAASNRENNRRYGTTKLSEPESRVIAALLERYHPDRIVSIHQPLKTIDFDGPAEGLARHMAACCSLPVAPIGSRPGSLGSYAGVDLGIPIITLELPGEATGRRPDALWQDYGRALLAAVVYPQVVGGEDLPSGGTAAPVAVALAVLVVASIWALVALEPRRKGMLTAAPACPNSPDRTA